MQYELEHTREILRMANAGLQNRLGALFRFGVVGNLSDGQLVQQFLTAECGADQAAFSGAFVERHGPMVLLQLAALGKSHDAEDAFQAAFLIPAARKAGLVTRFGYPGELAAHGVALRVARRAIANAARRRPSRALELRR